VDTEQGKIEMANQALGGAPSSVTADRPRKKISPCCIAWIIVFTVLAGIYIVKFAESEEKVKEFGNLQIGTSLVEALGRMGPPSHYLDNSEFEGRKCTELIYHGRLFFRGDRVLYFDADSGRLLAKKVWDMADVLY
jgi:hypothetical protein